MENRVTALVVDTNYLIASVIEVPLTDAGMKVVIAVNQSEMQAAIATNEIQIAIIDFRLSHAEPEGLVARLVAAGVPYIFCTAASEAEVFEHFAGARIIEKPFSVDQLMFAVTQTIGARIGRGHS